MRASALVSFLLEEISLELLKAAQMRILFAYSLNANHVKLALAAGADPNIRKDKTALMWASSSGHTEVVKLLLAAGADINAKDDIGQTALMLCTMYGTVKLLLDAGADPNIKNKKGLTVLMWYSYFGHDELVKLLLDAGADPNIKNNLGMTAFDLASQQEHVKTMKILKSKTLHQQKQ